MIILNIYTYELKNILMFSLATKLYSKKLLKLNK